MTILFTLSFLLTSSAQTPSKDESQDHERGIVVPDLIFTNIPGAPKLGMPHLITGTNNPVFSGGHGLAAPAFYDWDGDGVKDLLIGEFGSGIENGQHVGNFIRVYLNIGTAEAPEFSGDWKYACYPFEILSDGTPYSVEQSCCIGFTPQFVDLNNDGMIDMITGQYQGEVSWFKGSNNGFNRGEALNQEGEIRNVEWVKSQQYWLFSSASFGDFTGDGKPDLITGGSSLRISKNIGSTTNPAFKHRELLIDVHGMPLKSYEFTKEELKEFEEAQKHYGWPAPIGGSTKLSPYVFDWDNDGVLDLLVTNDYMHKNLAVVDFFKGVKTPKGFVFEKPKALFKHPDGMKEFPGCRPLIYITDWNNDGVNDLLVGVSIPSIKGKFKDFLTWNWEDSTGLFGPGKDPANIKIDINTDVDYYKNYIKDKLTTGINFDDYLSIRHNGYVYLMLGSK